MPLRRERTRDGAPSTIKRVLPDKRPRVEKLRSFKEFSDLEVALAKCLLWVGVSQTVIADMLGTYPLYISDIKLGKRFQHIVSLELWSRDVTGGLHKRITNSDFAQLWEDVYAIYNGKDLPPRISGALGRKGLKIRKPE